MKLNATADAAFPEFVFAGALLLPLLLVPAVLFAAPPVDAGLLVDAPLIGVVEPETGAVGDEMRDTLEVEPLVGAAVGAEGTPYKALSCEATVAGLA